MQTSPAGSGAPVERKVEPTLVALALLLLIDFVVCAVMLATDKNLQTDFGSVSPYYAHWYGVLAMGLVDLVAALVVLVLAVRPAGDGSPGFVRRNLGALGLLWSIVAIVAMVGIVSSWKQVGFGSQGQFQTYLFGTTAYPGVLSYIPWLYDALLATYVLTAVVAIGALWRGRKMARSVSA